MGSIYAAQLEDLIRSTRFAASSEGKVALSHLQGEIKYRLARGSPAVNFFIEISQSLTRIKGSAHAETRMHCLFDCVTFFYLNGHSAHALRTLNHVHQLATQIGSRTALRRAKTFLGVVFADLGNVAEAVPLHCRSFEIAQELDDPLGQTVSLLNLGVALNYGGLYREAIPCLRKAAAVASLADTMLDLHNTALTNLAQSYLNLEEYERGFEMIAQAIARSAVPHDAVASSARVVREYTYVRLALEMGKIELARTHAHDSKRFSHGSGLRGKCLSNITVALCEIHAGDVMAGIRSLEDASRECSETAIKETSLIALAKAYDRAEQPERALECLDALIVHLRASRERGIAALLEASPSFLRDSVISAEHADLRGLNLKKANLRAKVAERETISSQLEMLERFAVTAMLRDDATGEHGFRVGRLASLLGAELKLDPASLHALELGARLHDIGKIGVPDRILFSTKDLRDVERQFICAHTTFGAELLGKSTFPQVRVAEEIARHHHEWWNGDGYPSKLLGKQIPVPARIVAIADVFDALTHGRPYSEPWSVERALHEISERKGTQFDPELAETFVLMLRKLHKLHSDLDHFLTATNSESPFSHARSRIRRLLLAERAKDMGALHCEGELAT